MREEGFSILTSQGEWRVPVKGGKHSIAEAGPCEGRKSLLAEAEPGVFTPKAFLTRVKGKNPSTTGRTLMVV